MTRGWAASTSSRSTEPRAPNPDMSSTSARPGWRLLKDAIIDARQLDMGVYMTTGTGWCFGGPWVNGDDAALFATVINENAAPASEAENKKPSRHPPTVLRRGRRARWPAGYDRSRHHQPRGQTLQAAGWEGMESLRAAGQSRAGGETPAPGGAGPMINTVYPPAMDAYLKPFTEAFARPTSSCHGPCTTIHTNTRPVHRRRMANGRRTSWSSFQNAGGTIWASICPSSRERAMPIRSARPPGLSRDGFGSYRGDVFALD